METKHSDQLLEKVFTEGRGLSVAERQELRESYLWEQQEDERNKYKVQQAVKSFKDDKDPLHMPRHRVLPKFPHLEECPICFRMRGYDTANVKQYNDMQDHPEDYCMKAAIHNSKTFAMMIRRPRIDLDHK